MVQTEQTWVDSWGFLVLYFFSKKKGVLPKKVRDEKFIVFCQSSEVFVLGEGLFIILVKVHRELTRVLGPPKGSEYFTEMGPLDFREI